MEAGDGLMVMVGSGLTVTVTVCVLVQPLLPVPVTVYVVVTVGLAVTGEPVVELSPDAGAQVYETPPLAVSTTEPPVQMVAGEGLMAMEGSGLTVTVTVCVFVQPLLPVPVTV
jgi:hypothetical protein